jgi:endonuclease G
MATINEGDIRQALQRRSLAAAFYLQNPRVTLVDVGWPSTNGKTRREPGVRIHLRDKPRGPALEALTERSPELIIDKGLVPFPIDLVECRYELQWHDYPGQRSSRAGVFNPLMGGISISNEWDYNYGTLGGVVKDRRTGRAMILSAWHVLAGSANAPVGQRIYQPGQADGGWDYHTIGDLQRHAMDSGIDAAVASLAQYRSWSARQLDLDIGAVRGVLPPSLGTVVVKSGAGSEVTHGVIDGLGGDYPVRYGGFPHHIKHVIRIVSVDGAEVSRGGDSGSWWLQDQTGLATGLHFAGADSPEVGLAIAMPEVLAALNVDLATETGAATVPTGRAARTESVTVGGL